MFTSSWKLLCGCLFQTLLYIRNMKMSEGFLTAAYIQLQPFVCMLSVWSGDFIYSVSPNLLLTAVWNNNKLADLRVKDTAGTVEVIQKRSCCLNVRLQHSVCLGCISTKLWNCLWVCLGQRQHTLPALIRDLHTEEKRDCKTDFWLRACPAPGFKICAGFVQYQQNNIKVDLNWRVSSHFVTHRYGCN